jgi:hypothetical protein
LRAYCLYTGPARDRLGLQDVTTLVAHREEVPDFGLMETFIQDLGDAYRRADQRGIAIDDSELWFSLEADLPMGPAVVWDYLSSPVFRNILIGSSRQEVKGLVGGRIGVGSSFVCYHGNLVTNQRILEWVPFTKVVTEDTMAKPMKGTTLVVYQLMETPSGTHLSARLGAFTGPWWVRAFRKAAMNPIKKKQTQALDAFVETATKDHLRRFESGTAPH